MGNKKQLIAVQMLSLLLFGVTVFAQQNQDTTAVYYVADYNVEWESLMEWNQMYRDHSVPTLQELEEEGIITGWSAWMHNTGGEYNWRLVIGSSDWDNYDEFWDRYLSGYPEEVMEQSGDMLTSHRDQIWDAALVRYAENVDETQYIYEALYQIKFSNMPSWNSTMREREVPLWDAALEDGLIKGYVVLGHNTGDRYNHGRVYLFSEWDDMDDFTGSVMGEILSDAELWNRMGSMIEAHTDAIWERVPDQVEESN